MAYFGPGGRGDVLASKTPSGNVGSSFLDGLKNLGGFMGSKEGSGLLGLGSLALGGYGLNKSLGFANDQMDLLKGQENRAATAQNLGTGNQLSMALQMTTPGTPEHERIKQAIASGQFQV
jgi:hypothetical protein